MSNAISERGAADGAVVAVGSLVAGGEALAAGSLAAVGSVVEVGSVVKDGFASGEEVFVAPDCAAEPQAVTINKHASKSADTRD